MSEYQLVIIRESKLVWPVLALTALLTLTANDAARAQDDAQQQWCEKACRAAVATASAPPPVCDCTAFVTGGGGSAPDPRTGGGDQTVEDIFDEMIATHEAEMAQVQNYLLIEKKKASPLPNIRYFERKSGGEDDFVWIPNHELARRETARNPSNNRTGNQRVEVPTEMVDDPTVFVDGLADAASILGSFAGAEELGEAAEAAIDAESADIRDTLNSDGSRDGIEGADAIDLASDPLLPLFDPNNPDVTLSWGLFSDEVTPPVYERVSGLDEQMMNSVMAETVPPRGAESHSGFVTACMIFDLSPGIEIHPHVLARTGLAADVRIEAGELWACKLDETFALKPVRLFLEYREWFGAELTFIQKESYGFVRRDPVLFPRRVQNRIVREGQAFIDGLEREIRVNLAEEPTQADIATISGQAMDWDSFYNQSSP